MKKIIRKFIPIIELANSLTEKERKNYIKTANIDFIKFLSELFYNINLGSFKLERDILLKLKKYNKEIKLLSKKRTSLAARRKILSKRGFFEATISLLIPELIKIVSL